MHFIPCNEDIICLTATGKAVISNHHNTDKHEKAAMAANQSKPLADFMSSASATKVI